MCVEGRDRIRLKIVVVVVLFYLMLALMPDSKPSGLFFDNIEVLTF